jgi:glucose-1-phosphate thymidylyltransferase
MEAAAFVQTIEKRQGLKVACLEEIAYHNGWLSADCVLRQAEKLKKSGYGQYLVQVINESQGTRA